MGPHCAAIIGKLWLARAVDALACTLSPRIVAPGLLAELLQQPAQVFDVIF